MKTIINKKQNTFLIRWICILGGCILCFFHFSCEKFLDYKPDKQLLVPTTLRDCQALLDNYGFMNSTSNYPEAVSDNIYILNDGYNRLNISNRDTYIWKADADVNDGDWNYTYQRILYANQVLETLGKIDPSATEQTNWNEIKGAALFFRAYALYQGAQLWSKPYDPVTAGQDLGMPIKLSPDISEKYDRGTLQQTYDRILGDLKEALNLLPNTTSLQSRPSKIAAYAALARIYLSMGDYANAGLNADACLQRFDILMNYNELIANDAYPISRFNREVIFDVGSAGGANNILLRSVARIVPVLYDSYEQNDLRKTIFFTRNNDGTYGFKGSYNGQASSNCFTGLATDEIYLIRAECFARAGKKDQALADLNTLLKTRWSNAVTYVNKIAESNELALKLILAERRKELLFRGLRWSDLRRLNKDPDFAISLSRTVNGQTYTLPPNDLRYVLRIPTEVLNRVKLPQNPR